MEHVLEELARDRHQSLLEAAEARRDSRRAWRHSRVCRQAERAERRLASRWVQATRLRADLTELESAS